MPSTVPVIFVAVQWLLICSFLQRLFRFGAEQTSAAQHTGQLFSVHPVQATCLQLVAEANRSTDKGPQNVVYFVRGGRNLFRGRSGLFSTCRTDVHAHIEFVCVYLLKKQMCQPHVTNHPARR